MEDVIVYSAIIGKYDQEREDIKVFEEQPSDKFLLPVMNAKVYKVLSHKFLNVKYSIWLDGNIYLKVESSKLIEEFLGENDMAVFKCPSHNCIYDAKDLIKTRLNPEFHPLLEQQILDYQTDGMPSDYGMGECGMIIRRHNDVVAEFNERWWSEICIYTNRDQVSFAYIKWKMEDRIKISLIDGDVRTHSYFKYEHHLIS